MRYLNRWSVACIWVATMMVAWFALVPGVLSPGTWVVTTLGGLVLLVGAGMFWETTRPVPSFRQSRAATDVSESVATEKRR